MKAPAALVVLRHAPAADAVRFTRALRAYRNAVLSDYAPGPAFAPLWL